MMADLDIFRNSKYPEKSRYPSSRYREWTLQVIQNFSNWVNRHTTVKVAYLGLMVNRKVVCFVDIYDCASVWGAIEGSSNYVE